MILLADMLESSLLPAAMVILAMVVGMWTLRRAQQRSRRRQTSPREQIDKTRQASAARQSMQDLMIDLESFARKMNAQLDTKFARLETVIRHADERIAQLKALQGDSAADDAEEKTSPGDVKSSASSASAGPASTPARPPATRSPRAAAPAARPKPPPSSNEPRAQRVCELADEGRTAIQIAEQTGLTLGEVEVILQLRQAG